MGWTTPRTWATGERVAAQLLNVFIRDNLTVLDGSFGTFFGLVGTCDPRFDGVDATLTANRCYYGRVIGTATVTRIYLNPATSTGNISVAVYETNGDIGITATPTTRLITTGSIACPAAGAAAVALGASFLIENRHWLALSVSGAPQILMMNCPVGSFTSGLSGQQDSAHPAPSSATIGATTATPPALFGLD